MLGALPHNYRGEIISRLTFFSNNWGLNSGWVYMPRGKNVFRRMLRSSHQSKGSEWAGKDRPKWKETTAVVRIKKRPK